MLIGYARVSTIDQNLESQIDALKKCGCEKIYEEKKSGKDLKRDELNNLLDTLREGDTLVVYSWDRLSRSIKDLIEIIDKLDKKKINFKSLLEEMDTSTASGRLAFHFFAAIGEFFRRQLSEKTHAGLEAARARGRFGGRKHKVVDEKQLEVAIELYNRKKWPVKRIAKLLNVSHVTFYKLMKNKNSM